MRGAVARHAGAGTTARLVGAWLGHATPIRIGLDPPTDRVLEEYRPEKSWQTPGIPSILKRMNKLDEVLAAARRLPEADKRRLVAELEADENESRPGLQQREAMKRWLERAGTGHSDFTDVSSNKSWHLADISTTKR
jgi:hypothetical protein